MCGIIGYLGPQEAMPIILDGLKRLEYRGYDSAGMAVIHDQDLAIRRSLGKLIELEKLLSREPLPGQVGIGHTRWATHGRPSEANAHPHHGGFHRRSPQRHHRKLPGGQGATPQGGPQLLLGDGYGDRLPPHRPASAPGHGLPGGGAPHPGNRQRLLRPGHRQCQRAPDAGGGPQGKPPDPGSG